MDPPGTRAYPRLLAGALALVIASLVDLAIVVAVAATDTHWGLFLGNGFVVVAPVAAGIAGTLNARLTRLGRAAVVFLMATSTYAIGVLLGVYLFVAASNVTFEGLVVGVFFWIVGMFIALPLYPVCLAGAWLWAILVGRLFA